MLYSFYRRLSQLGGISTSRSVARPSSIFKNKLMQELYVNLAMVKDGCYAIFVKDKRRMWKQKTIGSTGVVHLAELLDTSCVPSAKFSNALPFQITVMVKTLTFKYQGADCLGVAAAGHLTTVDMSLLNNLHSCSHSPFFCVLPSAWQLTVRNKIMQIAYKIEIIDFTQEKRL